MTDKYSPHRKVDVLNLLSQHERGLALNSQYRTDVTNIKVNQLSQSSECTTRLSNYPDKYLRCHSFGVGPNGDLVAVWRDCVGHPKKLSILSVFKFVYSSPDNEAAANRPFFVEILQDHSLGECMLIIDTAYVSYLEQKPVLFVGNFNRGSSAILTFYPYSRNYPRKDLEWKFDSHSFCCASVRNTETFAVGCTNGFYICKNLRLSEKYYLPNDVLAAEFNDDGNLLFISCLFDGIELCDLRERKRPRRNSPAILKEPALGDSSLVADRMKLLSNQITLVVSDKEGDISKIDLRMNRAVFQYPEHKGFPNNRPLSIDEDLDLLCAVGKDNYTRVWSLSSGKLHWASKIAVNEALPTPNHACIVSSERRWFIFVLQDKTVFSVIPGINEAVCHYF